MLNGKGKKIALVGCAPASANMAPFFDDEWEIWACSPNQVQTIQRFDVWFEIHCLDLPKRAPLSQNYVSWLATLPRVVMQEPDPRVPYSEAYPLEEVRATFGGGSPFVDSFLSSSFSLMAAMALLQRPPAIGCWGFDLHSPGEYDHQRPGFHFFCWHSYHMRIPMFSSPESDIMQPMPVYGFRERSPLWRRYEAHKIVHQAKIDEAKARLEQAKHDLAMFEGALQQDIIVQNCWAGVRREMVKARECDGEIVVEPPPENRKVTEPPALEDHKEGAA